MARRSAPSVNAGSMADIAFLLLIFFLVTTTIQTDYGISRKLPPLIDDPIDNSIRKKNLFTVELNQFNELLVEGEKMKLTELKDTAIAFLDNGGGIGELSCSYCKGEHDSRSSDNPDKAVISIINNRKTNYETYIIVQNELVSAYTTLRNREAKELYGVSFEELERDFKNTSNAKDREQLREKVKRIQSMFPEKISEAEPVFQ